MLVLPFILFVIWASCFPLSKIALQSSTPLFFTASRMLLAAVLILAYQLLKKRSDLKISKKQFAAIIFLGFFSMYLTNALEYYSLKYLSGAKACFIYSLTPIFAAIFSYIHFKEKLSFKKFIGMSIAFLGIIPVFFIQSDSEKISKSFFNISLPEIAVILAVIFSVYGWILLRILVKGKNNTSEKEKPISPLTANSLGMLIGGIFALIHSLISDTWLPIPIKTNEGFHFIQGVFAITMISNIVCYNLYGYLLKKYTATFMSFVGLLSPIFASFSEWILLKTSPSPIILVSTLVIISGLWIVYQEELKQGYITTSKKAVKE
jgi:drug/metabolite transporter (DMT)-like permease